MDIPIANDNAEILRNQDLVVLALYELNGDDSPVELEHIAYKVSALAPGRFNWRHYPEQIDIERVRVRLSDNKKAEHGRRVAGGGKSGWWLTAAGLVWAVKASKEVSLTAQARPPIDATENRRRNIELVRIQNLPAWDKFQSSQLASATLAEAEAVFRLEEYVEGDRRKQIVDRGLNLFSSDEQISEFLQEMATVVLPARENADD